MSLDREINTAQFTALDYIVLIGILVTSCGIGIFYAWKDRKEKDTDAYLVGKRNMSPLPVGISLCVTYASGLLTVGFPTQVYYYGSIIIWILANYWTSPLIAGLYYIPLFFRLKVTSVYEVLEIRYGVVSRTVASASVIILLLLYMAIVMLIPCMALSAVSSVPVYVAIVVTCSIVTFYTTLGGMKAVIWTDVLQASVMLVGLTSVVVVGVIHVGGVSKVFDALGRGDRLNFVEWTLDPYMRHSTLSLLTGPTIIYTMKATVTQPNVQRYMSCKSVRVATQAAWLILLPQLTFVSLALCIGAISYAFFEGCDPVQSNQIETKDQIIPFMVVNLFQNKPGLAGLFIAGVYSSSISSMSSGINSLPSLILTDFVSKVKPSVNVKSLLITKCLVATMGVIVLALTFMILALGKTVVNLFFAIFGGFGGPLLAVYTMAMFLPWSNWKGAVAGHIAGVAISIWMSIGQLFYPVPTSITKLKPLTTEYCVLPNATTSENLLSFDWNNSTGAGMTDSYFEDGRPAIARYFYAITSDHIGLIGFLVTLIVGLSVSGLTGFEDPKHANVDIFTPVLDGKWLPRKIRKFLRFGVPERNADQEKNRYNLTMGIMAQEA